MKKFLLIFVCAFLVLFFLFSFANGQSLVAGGQPTTFRYDESGNRIARNTIVLRTQHSEPDYEPQGGPRRAGAVPRGDEEDYCSDDEAYFVPTSTMEMPENNEILEHFYTDRLNESDVVIFPNPTRGALAVEILNMNPNVPHQITVLSVRGLVVFQKNNITNFTEIDLSAQPRGVYLLRISSQERFITWKIIKE